MGSLHCTVQLLTLLTMCSQFWKELFTQEHTKGHRQSNYTKVFSVLLDVKVQMKHTPVSCSMYINSIHPACLQQQDPFKTCNLIFFFLCGCTMPVNHLLPCPLFSPPSKIFLRGIFSLVNREVKWYTNTHIQNEIRLAQPNDS